MLRKLFKVMVALAVVLALLSAAPEVVMLYAVIEAIGFDVFVMMCEVQIIAIFYTYFGQHIVRFFSWLNSTFEKLDPYYFIPSKKLIREFPPIVFHACPFLVGGMVMLTIGASVYG